MIMIITGTLCLIVGFILGTGASMGAYERKIKGGYVQVDGDIYVTRLVLRGKEPEEQWKE